VLTSEPPTVANGPPSATFLTLAETSSYSLVYNLNFLNNALLDCTKNAYNQCGFSNAIFTTSSLTRQMLATKLFTTHFGMVGLDNRNPWVVRRSIYLTY